VIERAKVVLEALERGEREGRQKAVIEDLPLFSATQAPSAAKAAPSEVEARLKDILPDNLSPKDALGLIYELKDMIRTSE
jgi:DNA mismatch repair protein MutS